VESVAIDHRRLFQTAIAMIEGHFGGESSDADVDLEGRVWEGRLVPAGNRV
jgi:hypothetical protein